MSQSFWDGVMAALLAIWFGGAIAFAVYSYVVATSVEGLQ